MMEAGQEAIPKIEQLSGGKIPGEGISAPFTANGDKTYKNVYSYAKEKLLISKQISCSTL